MNDPLSALSAPPPRYLLESDSSDEEGQGAYPGSAPASRPKIQLDQPPATVTLPTGGTVEGTVVATGQAGRFLLKHLPAPTGSEGVIKIGDEKVGVIRAFEKELVVLVDDGDLSHESVWAIAKKLVEDIQSPQWTTLSSYVPAMYIAKAKSSHLDPPVRFISSSSSQKTEVQGAERYDPPNFISGLAGAFLTLSALPTTSLQSTTAILLPLPLSRLAISHLSTPLSSSSSSIASLLKGKRSQWTDDDDEPYSAPGMGRVRGARHGHVAGEGVGMYT
ncbi:hypothetical protein L198_04555 [Cryptococcus wingfieldii CBS 7118]|uniref:Uncharacterized protein n=1 Tax=Cryptococcus wingfieldii CBS 7118 TaxID=1295528 RepID=A0A1E3J2T7_9TREE|nr:hypothetical protein L198_04555 [Cryptococcus wingfieldii CBS 7118]ODN95168.1 hypothetical protein L198_04555 [Cryptococcus wingfieldii CBS 7118]